jgi:hypothetical protein
MTAALALVALRAPALAGQTDYYNTDAGRPVQVEDAFPVERHAFEVQVAPVRVERSSGGLYSWELEPELAYGILPRTHLEVGLPLVYADGFGGSDGLEVAGVHLSFLHNLNVETAGLPAFALGGRLLAPVGGAAPEELQAGLKGVVTRTFRVARFHVNGGFNLDAADPEEEDPELARWGVGLAIDRTLPLHAALITAAVIFEDPSSDALNDRWTVEAGARYQLNQHFALDAGLGKRLTGDDRPWYLTFGAARAFAIRSLISVPGR